MHRLLLERIGKTYAVLSVAALLLLAACSGPQAGRDVQPEAPEELPTPAVDLSDYEDFDPSAYPDEAPAQEEIRHDVPRSLMEGRAAAGTTTTASGFRVQIFSTLDKSAAVTAEEEAKAWWQAEQSTGAAPGLFPDDLPIYTVYRQPYYRVRVGNFTSRAAAERARTYLARRFPEAFIVPDTVTIRR